MASPRPGNVWDEIHAVANALPLATAANLRQLIITINARTRTHINRTGKKQELVDRITHYFDELKAKNDAMAWKAIKSGVDALNLPTSRRPKSNSSPADSLPPAHSHRAGSSYGSSSSAGTSQFSSFQRPQNNFRFRQSPFFTVNEALTKMHECPESYSSSDRREVTLTFNLDPAQLARVNTPSSGTQVRLFCTSSKFFSPQRPTNPDLPIEFPSTCEVFVNDTQLKNTTLKGMKRVPGTAPPPDLGVGGLRAVKNVVKMIYINHTPQGQQPEFKKFYLVAQLVQTHTVASLVETLKLTRFVSGDNIRRQMLAMNVDDDILAGTLKLSLKCPLSFARMSLPTRSSKCTHSQCFDAASWYSMMEQTTTWMCPICETKLDWRDLVIDGLVAEILRLTPPNVDHVLLDADGTWRTQDGRYSSARPFDAATEQPIPEFDDSDDDY
ncbi:hypothetical protein HMN09_00379900 [Mycena chlorophos]|uniref:Uncharacterized protein n=1 Tax=Mycena chlorophos TaxID=658473 RepID=A0A8H6TL47_MYCCL|nr:hypothetical protein HMN09_00379900 [Mycena chlorophos]